MSRVKSDLSKVSLNQLCTLTGKTSRTLKKLLADVSPDEDGNTLFYVPSEVLPIIYEVRESYGSIGDGPDGRPVYDPIQQRARLDKLKADKVELEVAQLRKQLIHVDKVEASWQRILGAFRSKILNMPAKISPRLCATKEIKEIEKILKAECHEALTELSQYGDGLAIERPQPKSR